MSTAVPLLPLCAFMALFYGDLYLHPSYSQQHRRLHSLMQHQTDLNTTQKLSALSGNFPLRLSDSVMIDRRRQLCRRDDGTLQDTADCDAVAVSSLFPIPYGSPSTHRL